MADSINAHAPTVTVTAALHSAGHNVGGKLTLAGVVHTDRPYGMIRGVRLTTDVISTGTFDVFFFHADPSGSTFTTAVAQAIVAADQAKVSGVASLSEVFADGDCSVHQASSLAIPFVAAAAGTIYCAIVARAAITFAATTNVSLRVLIQEAGA